MHKDFAINWLLEDRTDDKKGEPLFNRENARSASYYANRTFEPEWRRIPEDILPPNRYGLVTFIFVDERKKFLSGNLNDFSGIILVKIILHVSIFAIYL